ncbi:hypothetical protein [Silvimonas amylolytica]|uniref:Exo-alpha-sialidase n=1 Tax=Silvimonas amylolytica TaxID=449663 RepID=A0ABQ2PQB5_9NEIS|nr:hypothetical protein [Silvimonas amylolytica]GGP27134.1 hypothetical protein GCM10010971_29530 [Silvimonas amylolytica]
MQLRQMMMLGTLVLGSAALTACGGSSGDGSSTSVSAPVATPTPTPAPSSSATPTPTPAPSAATASIKWSLDAGNSPIAAKINSGTAIGKGAGGTPFTLDKLVGDANNTQNVTNPFLSTGTVPDPAYGYCDFTASPATRISYATVGTFVTPPTDPMVNMAPFYFPLVYTSNLTTAGHVTTTSTPLIGLFDWRPKDINESVVAAESDDNGKTWYFMQNVLELNPGSCPTDVHSTFASTDADDGWGHASILQLPGTSAATGQMLYTLNRDPAQVDVAPLNVIALPLASAKFPLWNTNTTNPGGQDINTISTALTNTAGATNPVVVKQTVGLLNPDGILAVVPNTDPTKPTTVIYVQKILNGDKTGSTAMPTANQCTAAPFSGKTNHDISNVRLATTMDGINFIDQGVVSGLNDPTSVDYNKTRWISPRGTLIDINGDGSRWGLLFSGGNCLDGDSDAFHYIGYAESTDLKNWTVFNDINSPIASINSITTTNQGGNKNTVTVPANTPVIPTQPWFAQRLYAPSAVQIDATHLSMTFAGYAVQTPGTNLMNYRQIGNVMLTTSKSLPKAPNNINNQ